MMLMKKKKKVMVQCLIDYFDTKKVNEENGDAPLAYRAERERRAITLMMMMRMTMKHAWWVKRLRDKDKTPQKTKKKK